MGLNNPGTAPTVEEIQTEIEENSASLLDTIRDEPAMQQGGSNYGQETIRVKVQ